MKIRAVFDSDRGLCVEITAMTTQEKRIMGLLMDEPPKGPGFVSRLQCPMTATLEIGDAHISYGEFEKITIRKVGETKPEEA